MPSTDGFAALVGSHVETIFLEDLLGDHEPYRLEAAANPNLIFMRDSSVTLPWAPSAFIPARPALASRAREADVVGRALEHLGMRALTRFEHDEYLEGGDLLAGHLRRQARAADRLRRPHHEGRSDQAGARPG